MDIVTQRINIHAFAVLVYAKSKSSSDFLTFSYIAATLLQCANLKNIRVVPSLAQC